MRKWTEDDFAKLRKLVMFDLKAGRSILETLTNCRGYAYGDPKETPIEVPDEVWYKVLVQLVERKEIDVIVT